MSSQVDIANKALIKIGDKRIISFEDGTEQSNVISSVWELTRDTVLRSHVWSFAVKRASLAALVDTPEFGYLYQYPVPSDCLRIVEVMYSREVSSLSYYLTDSKTVYAVENNKILTDITAPLYIKYLSRVEDTNLYSVDFIEALACKLAAEIAQTLTNSTTIKNQCIAEYEMAINNAIRTNSLELPSQPLLDDSLMLGRL